MTKQAHLPTPTDPLGPDWALVRPVMSTNPRFWIVVGVLLSGIGVGVGAYSYQLRYGLGVTGMNRPVYWGIYIVNFVFFIGISHAGTLISAILRLAKAEWRRAVTRSAEVITVMVIVFGVANVIFDLGRPDRAAFVILHGRMQSPLLWDVCSITIYLACSTIYLYLPLIPDIAILRDQTPKRRWLYRPLALGWQGTPRQHRVLERAIGILMVLVIPVAVSVHTVVSFVFAMTVQPMWHTAIFGPYFVVGAIFSGIAALIIAMAIIRWAYHLEGYLKQIHFDYLGILLFVMTLLWLYFTAAEYLTTWYGAEPVEMTVWWAKVSGRYAAPFWTMFTCCFVVPFALLCRRKTRTVAGTVVASAFITVGMWLERFIIVVPTISNPRLPIDRGVYLPTWVEWSMLLGCFCFFILLYVLFTRFFPIVSIWEIQEGRLTARRELMERVERYLPDTKPLAARTGAAVILALVLSAPAVTRGADAVPEASGEVGAALGNVETGWELFRTKSCLRCHAVWGQGGDVGPDLGRTQTLGHVNAGQLAGTMWNHVPRMWQRMEEGGLEMTPISVDEMGHLFAFLLFIHYADEPGDPDAGRRALERHGCDRCHVIGSEGGSVGPDLTTWGRYVNPVVWAQKMWRHAREMQDVMAAKGVSWPRFSGTELNDIVSFVRSRSTGERKEYMRPGSAARGHRLFETRGCASCHESTGSRAAVPNLDRADLPDTLSGIATQMWNHAPAMLEEAERQGRIEQIQQLEAQDMLDVITYLLTRRYFFSPGDAEAGRRVFVAKRCVECHEVEGQGTTAGPRLSEIRGQASPIFMAHVMWQFGPKMLGEMTARGIPWPQFEGSEMSDLITYLNASPKQAKGG